jgi:heptosyltransferase II
MNMQPDQNWNERSARLESSPILVVPYRWIGDFVRCHSVVRVLKERWPWRPVDVLVTTLTAPLADYMPGIRQSIVFDLPRRTFGLSRQLDVVRRLRAERYGTALVLPRKWKAAVAPFLAGIPVRTGWVGEVRFVLLSDPRWGELRLPRMIDRCATLALPSGSKLPEEWPAPQLIVRPAEISGWRGRHGIAGDARAVALAPGAVGPSKRWPTQKYTALARDLIAQGFSVWVFGGPQETAIAEEITAATGGIARNFTGTDLREAIHGLAAAAAVVSNDSGLMHVAAALGRPTIGIFGPTSPWHWAPLNGLDAVIQSNTVVPCRPCHRPVCRMGHHACMQNIAVAQVIEATQHALARADITAAPI